MEFTDLPPDIYIDIAQQLAPNDTFALLSTCKVLAGYLDDQIYKIIYKQLYPHEPIVHDIPRQFGWLYYLNHRTRGRLYTWGESLRARLGYSSTESVFPSARGPLRGVSTPRNVASFNQWAIRLIHSTGFSFVVLMQPAASTRAQLYYTGYQWRDTSYSQDTVSPGPARRDVPSTTITQRIEGISLPGRIGVTMIRWRGNPPVYDAPETAYVSPLLVVGDQGDFEDDDDTQIRETEIEVRGRDPIVQVECGRQHIMAMSRQGRLWTWDSGIPGNCAVELDLRKVISMFSRTQGTSGRSLRVTKIRCSWNANSCYVPGLGIIVWNERDTVVDDKNRKVEFGSYAHLVPDTQYVTDYACVFDDILYIDSTGRGICHYHDGKTEAISSVSLDKLAPQTTTPGQDPSYEEYSLLLACYDKFIATTTTSRTVVYNVRQGSGVTVELPEDAAPLVDIAMGDYHYLALTADGELYAWGHESRSCGCLGVEAVRTLRDLDVAKPTLVTKPAPGKWLAVTAGGWQSAGIFVEDKE